MWQKHWYNYKITSISKKQNCMKLENIKIYYPLKSLKLFRVFRPSRIANNEELKKQCRMVNSDKDVCKSCRSHQLGVVYSQI